jgi:hypothetical protein
MHRYHLKGLCHEMNSSLKDYAMPAYHLKGLCHERDEYFSLKDYAMPAYHLKGMCHEMNRFLGRTMLFMLFNSVRSGNFHLFRTKHIFFTKFREDT